MTLVDLVLFLGAFLFVFFGMIWLGRSFVSLMGRIPLFNWFYRLVRFRRRDRFSVW